MPKASNHLFANDHLHYKEKQSVHNPYPVLSYQPHSCHHSPIRYLTPLSNLLYITHTTKKNLLAIQLGFLLMLFNQV